MTLILAFIIGLLASVAGYFLHGIVHEIQLLLTSGFNKGTYNLLFLLSRLWAFTSPCSLLNMWSEIIFPTVSPVCFTPSLPKFQAQGPQLLVIGGGIRYHHRFRWFRGSRGSYCAHGFGHRLKPGTNLPHGQETMILLVGCGASAAIAGIFKAPIAGLVFTLEVLMVDLSMASLLPILISCVTATCFTYILMGSKSLFDFTLTNPWALDRVPACLLLGIFAVW